MLATLSRTAVLAVAIVVHSGSAQAADVTGAGSTFVFPILSKWSSEYGALHGTKVTYQSIGSGGGITQIKSATVDFAASDAPLKSDELQKLGMGQFPIVIGGIVPVFNIDGIAAGDLKFTGPLPNIFLGRVKTWNDPAIAQLNPGVKLPNATIAVVHRSDSSGTTFNWTNYFSKISPEWRAKVGEGTAVQWPLGAGGKGNEGVAVFVKQTNNSIGYVEFAYVLQNNLTFGLLQNRAGKFIKPNAMSFQAAAASADWAATRDFFLIMTDAPGDDAYPVAASAFIIMHKNPRDASRNRSAMQFFRWAMLHGQKQASALDYVPIPSRLVQQIEGYWKANFSSALD